MTAIVYEGDLPWRGGVVSILGYLSCHLNQ